MHTYASPCMYSSVEIWRLAWVSTQVAGGGWRGIAVWKKATGNTRAAELLPAVPTEPPTDSI